MISSISPRSPRKTSGLFDTGFAGGALDATSLDLNAPADVFDDPFSLGSLNSVNFTLQPDTTQSVTKPELYQAGKINHVQPAVMGEMDLLDPLADLETDQLADDSLDAFVNLEDFLMGDAFLEEEKTDFDSIFSESAEVKPVINMPTAEINFDIGDFGITESTSNTFFTSTEELPLKEKSRKRKAATELQPLVTSLFEIPVSENVVSTTSPSSDPQLDHDYTTKRQKKSLTSGGPQKYRPTTTATCSGTGNSKGRPAKTIAVLDEPSTSFAEVSDKQAVRRIKNNVASKRSREQRKQKFVDLDKEAEDLIIANDGLKKKIVELERVAKEMKALLVAKMAGN